MHCSTTATAIPASSETEPSIIVEDCHPKHQNRRRSRTDSITLTLEDLQPSSCRRRITIDVPRVTFYPCANIKPYDLDLQYAQVKSYSKEEMKGFSKTMYLDVVRIKRYVQSKTTSKQSLLRLLKNDIILSEDIRGIEYLLMCKTLSKDVYHERRDHVTAVLSEQKRIAREVTQLKIEDTEYLSERLAQFSASRSSKSAKHARIRAYT
jgi:hypothetical protein